MKKLSALMVGACLALSMAATPVYATEAEHAKVQLLTVQAESSYRDSDVDIQYREDRETNTVTADFSWAQINQVNKCGHQSGNSGAYHLQAANTTVRTTQFPCNTVSMQINGIIEVSSTNTVGFSFSGLQALGFGMSGSSSSQWTARKSYNRQTSFSLM